MTRSFRISSVSIGLVSALFLVGCEGIDSLVRDMDPARIRPTHDITVSGQQVQVIEPSQYEQSLGATQWQVRVDGRFFPCEQPTDESCSAAARAAMSQMANNY